MKSGNLVKSQLTLHTFANRRIRRPRPPYVGEIWKRRFHSVNTWNVFRPHYAREIWKPNNHRRQKRLSAPLRVRVNHMIILTSYFEKLRFQNVFRPHKKRKAGVFKFLRFEERFRKAPFSVDNFSGLVWTVGLRVEIKLRFQISPA